MSFAVLVMIKGIATIPALLPRSRRCFEKDERRVGSQTGVCLDTVQTEMKVTICNLPCADNQSETMTAIDTTRYHTHHSDVSIIGAIYVWLRSSDGRRINAVACHRPVVCSGRVNLGCSISLSAALYCLFSCATYRGGTMMLDWYSTNYIWFSADQGDSSQPLDFHDLL